MDENIMKMALLHIFLQPARVYTISELAEHFDVSRKTMSNNVQALKLSLPKGWKLISQARNGIKLEKPANQSSYLLKSKIWEQTDLVSLLLLLLKSDSINKTILAEQLYLSKPKTQDLLMTLSQLLSLFDLALITSPKITIEGNESTIRYFFYWVFAAFFGGGPVNKSLQKRIPYYSEVYEHMENHDIRIIPEKWRLAMLIVISLNRNATKRHIEPAFGNTHEVLSNDFLSSFIEAFYVEKLSALDHVFLDMVKCNIFGQLKLSKMLFLVGCHSLGHLITLFMNQLHHVPERFVIAADGIEYFFVKNIWRWAMQDAFHLPTLIFSDYKQTNESFYLKNLKTVLEQLANESNYPELFNEENIENFIFSLSLLLNTTKLLHISIVLSLSPGLANQLGTFISMRYGNQVTVRIFTNLTDVNTENTDILISDFNTDAYKNFPTLIVELFEHDGLIPLLDSFVQPYLN